MSDTIYTEVLAAAETAFQNHAFETALTYYQKALEEKKNDVYSLSRAGMTCIALQKANEAIGYFKRAVEIDGKNGDNYYNLGNAYFFLKEYDKCLDNYTKAEMYGCSDDVKLKMSYQKALLCSARGDVKAALIYLDKYEKLCNGSLRAIKPQLYKERARLYLFNQDLENAELNAAKLVSIEPSNFENYALYYTILIYRAKFAQAETVMADAEAYAASTDEEKYSLYMHMATTYTQLSSMKESAAADPHYYEEKAVEYFNKVLALPKAAGSHADALLNLATLYMSKDKTDKAIKILKNVLPVEEIKHIYADVELLNENDLELSDDDDLEDEEEDADDEPRFGIVLTGRSFFHYDDDDDDDDTAAAVVEKAEPVTAETASAELEDVKETKLEVDLLTREQVASYRFVLMSCYEKMRAFKEVIPLAQYLKKNKNTQYQYFAMYCEAKAMKMLADTDAAFTADQAERKYAEVIAFFRNCMIQKTDDHLAAALRCRMYAEIGSYNKAEEVADLLEEEEQKALKLYIQVCRENA